MKESSETGAIPSKLTKHPSKFLQPNTQKSTSITSLYLLL